MNILQPQSYPNKLFVLIVFIGVVLLISIGCNPQRQDRSERPAFKGMELYSWQDEDGQWLFSIMLGTNRVKTISEVQTSPIDISDVKRQFCEMVRGEQVFWMESVQDTTTGESYTFPQVPDTIVHEIQAQAESCGIVLYK